MSASPQQPNRLEREDPLGIKERAYPYGLFSALSLVLAVLLFMNLKDYYSGSYKNSGDKMVESVVSSLFTIAFTLAVLFLCIEFRKEILSINDHLPKIRHYVKTHKKFVFAIVGIVVLGVAAIVWLCFGHDISGSTTNLRY